MKTTTAAAFRLQESARDPARCVHRATVLAGDPWVHALSAGQVLRIVDLEGNQAVDALFYNDRQRAEHYSATETLLRQGGIYLTTGTTLYGDLGTPLLSIVADTCGRHDTLGGACSAESNMVRYALGRKFMHSCRDSFLRALQSENLGLGKADLAPNVNFFMHVPVTAEGGLRFADGVSAPGKYVELKAETDVLVLISNCPQLNNPCNAYHPTPVECLVWDPA